MSDALLNYIPDAGALDGRVILVTGAGDGIGRSVAKVYASYGATVVLLGKTIEKLEKVYDEITDAGHPEPAIYPLDMAGATVHDYLEMSRILDEQLNGLDGLVLNAAWMPGFVPFEQYDLELWQKAMTVNLTANYLMTQACLPLLVKSDQGAIIHSAHELTRAYSGAFGIAKAGMAAMMNIVADEYDNPERFIRVNSIDTGPLRTQMRRRNYPGEDTDLLASPEAVLGPYLYFMCAHDKAGTAETVSLGQLDKDFVWPGLAAGE
ncbi:SDR family NAD(P)-dependent oxidoreductase [Leucothrix sargassi]|nr:SDR family NAD(P)-dependent oxidoreductase [Leucothrix sargassi]